jgi:glucokinase
MSFYLGVDVGGTKVAIALTNSRGKIIRDTRIPTFPGVAEKSDAKGLVSRIVTAAIGLAEPKDRKRILGLGLASAGPMDLHKGILLNPTHFPGWGKIPIVSYFKDELRKQKLRIPVHFQNNAMAASLGEGWVGAAKGLQSNVTITVGTGIGSGVVFKGAPAQFQGMGSEWGLGIISFTSLAPSQGSWQGSTEAFASGTGLLIRAKEAGFKGTTIREAAFENGRYQYLFDDAALALASLAHNLSLGYHPEAIIFTGGVMRLKEFFWHNLRTQYALLMQKNPNFKAPLKLAKLGDAAGVIGAASLVRPSLANIL